MDVYLVGGAVRDDLLGLPVEERDWVVVGATPEELLALGYRQVGRDFPVFLHPDTGEEYALARTERKSGPGHKGFVVHAGPEVTLEEDLERRDLTVNAMARSAGGELFDPFGGRRDLERRVLRHVSAAFNEDPLRVFRVARFAAQLEGFEVAEETLALMTGMRRAGALDELSAERVWGELNKALATRAPGRFFEVLARAQCLEPWFAELERAEVALPSALSSPLDRYAALAGSLGEAAAEALGARLRCPNAARRLALLTARYADVLADWPARSGSELHAVLAATRAFRRPGESDLPALLNVVAALKGVELSSLLDEVSALNATVTVSSLKAQGFEGAALGRALEAARIRYLDDS